MVKRLPARSCDHFIKLWRSRDHELLATLDGPPGEARCLALSPDGSMLASGGHGGKIVVWDIAVRTAKYEHTLDDTSLNIETIAWLPGESTELVFAAGAGVFLWNVATDQQRQVAGPAAAVAVSSSTREIAVGRNDQQVEIRHPESYADAVIMPGYARHNSESVAFSSDGKWLAAGGNDHVVRVWDSAGGRPRHLFGHQERVQCVAFSPRPADRGLLASASRDGSVKLWETSRSESMPRVTSPCFYASGGKGVFHPTDGINRAGCVGLRDQVAISQDFRHVAIRSAAAAVDVFAMTNGDKLTSIPIERSVSTRLNFFRAEKPRLFGIADGKRVGTWDIQAGAIMEAFPHVEAAGPSCQRMLLSPSGAISYISATASLP